MAKWAWIDGVNLKACYLHGRCYRPKLGEKCPGCERLLEQIRLNETKPFMAEIALTEELDEPGTEE